MAAIFLDTNVLLRHLLDDDPQQSPKASAFLGRVERGEIRIRLADTVVFETVFNLQRRRGVSKAAIRDKLLPLLGLPTVELPGKHRIEKVFALYVDTNISFADALHAVLMEQLGIERIVSFDRDFDRVPGITRVEPS